MWVFQPRRLETSVMNRSTVVEEPEDMEVQASMGPREVAVFPRVGVDAEGGGDEDGAAGIGMLVVLLDVSEGIAVGVGVGIVDQGVEAAVVLLVRVGHAVVVVVSVDAVGQGIAVGVGEAFVGQAIEVVVGAVTDFGGAIGVEGVGAGG